MRLVPQWGHVRLARANRLLETNGKTNPRNVIPLFPLCDVTCCVSDESAKEGPRHGLNHRIRYPFFFASFWIRTSIRPVLSIILFKFLMSVCSFRAFFNIFFVGGLEILLAFNMAARYRRTCLGNRRLVRRANPDFLLDRYIL